MVTANRKVKVELDVPTFNTYQPAFYHDLEMDEISEESQDFVQNVHLVPDVGWRIPAYHLKPSIIHETARGDAGVMALILATSGGTTQIRQQDVYYPPLDNDGTPLSGRTRLGDKFYVKDVASQDSFRLELTSDVAAYGKPFEEDDLVPMDRIACSEQISNPGEFINLRFDACDEPGLSAVSTLVTLYFTSLPGSKQGEADGLGQYAIKFGGDGNAELKERLAGGAWVHRRTMQYAPPHSVIGASHIIFICSDAKEDYGGNWSGSVIKFGFLAIANAPDIAIAMARINAKDPSIWTSYYPPQFKPDLQPVDQPVRLDMRTNFRAYFQINQGLFFDSGTLRCKAFCLPYTPDTTQFMELQWFGDIPEGCTVTGKIYSLKTDTECPDDGIIFSGIGGGGQRFQPISGETHYYAVLTLNSNGTNSRTPTINRVRIARPALQALRTPDAVTCEKVQELSIVDQGADPTFQSAGVKLTDVGGTLSRLDERAGMTARVKLYYSADDPTLFSQLFFGRMLEAKKFVLGPKQANQRKINGTSIDQYAADYWGTYWLKLAGEHIRLWEQQSPTTYNFAIEPNDSLGGIRQPYRVTSVIKLLLLTRYPDHMVDVPDRDLRLFSDGKTPFVVEAFTPLGPLCLSLARDYLGAYLVFDENATADVANYGTESYGCWRLRFPQRPKTLSDPLSYNFLAEFVGGPNQKGDTTDGHFRGYGTMDLDAYKDGPDIDQGLTGMADGQVLKRIPIRKFTKFGHVVRPEGNQVVVTGAGFVPDQAKGTSKQSALTAIASNYKSAWFRPDQPIAVDPTSPDYIDGDVHTIYIADPGFQTDRAVRFVARRVYDMACHGQIHHIFDAPLALVWDKEDDKQIRPRKLRFGDMVLYSGEPYVVAGCHYDSETEKGGSRNGLATYQIFKVPELSDYSKVVVGRDL